MPIRAIPTISDIERIAAVPDAVIRNLQITQCYHELALAMAERTGRTANWCTFATWASKQAGQTIRREDLGRALEASLGSQASTQEALHELARVARQLSARLGSEEIAALIRKVYDPQAAFVRSSAAVARGNLKVFAEIGREFARFYSACLQDQDYDEDKITLFCETLRPGEPPDGQDYLRQAFRNYYQGFFEVDKKQQTELLLLANLQIGYHEQTRLQPEINEALAAAVIAPDIFTRNLLQALRPNWGSLNDVIWYVLRLFGRLTDLDSAITAYLAAAQREAQHIVTESMMTIELPPQELLRLGDDLAAGFPPILEHVANVGLLALLAQIDPTPDSPSQSGAEFWGDLPDRIHFIADMFRCYQTRAELFEPPFSAEQTADLKEGRLPAGRL